MAFNIAEIAQPLSEFFEAPLSGFIGLEGVAEEADTRHLRWRLCLDSKWRYKHTQGERNKAPDSAEPHGDCPTPTSHIPATTVCTAGISTHTLPLATV